MKPKKQQIEILVLLIMSMILVYSALMTNLLAEDEAVYLDTANKIMENGIYPQRDFLGNPKTTYPFFPIVLSFSSYSLPLSKVMVSIFGVLSIFIVYLFCERYLKEGSGIIGASLLFSIPLFVHFSMIDYTEILITFFSIISFYFFLKAEKLKDSIIPGIFIGLGMLTKSSMFLVPIAFLFYSIYKRKLKIWFITSLIAFLILSPWVIREYVLFGYSFYPGFSNIHNFLFGNPYPPIAPAELTVPAQPPIRPLSIVNNLGILITFLSIVGFLYSYYDKNKIGLLCFLLFIVFIVAWYSGISGIRDIRHFSIIFAQLSILGAIGFSSLAESDKYKKTLSLVLIVIVIFSMYSGISMALSTFSNIRYGGEIVKALEWVDKNSDEDEVLMTVFCGAGMFYSKRECVWPVKDLPKIMTTNSDEEIINILENYKVNYIFIQANLVSQSYVAPGTNIIGVFSSNFVNTISKSDKFELVYESENKVVYAPGLALSDMIIYKIL